MPSVLPGARPAPASSAAPFELLAHLWLHEPDLERANLLRDLARARGIALDASGAPADLAAAYAGLFLLNVPPYGTAYTDPWGEINTPAAQQIAALFETHRYEPAELRAVGAPDHLGLCLGFLGRVDSSTRCAFAARLLEWAPICTLAVERDPSATPFYRALAGLTRAALFAEATTEHERNTRFALGVEAPGWSDDEVRLRDVTRYLLAPARCGFFLSRARLGACALALGMRLPFGARREVAEWLFAASGEGGRVVDLLRLLDAEARHWDEAYHLWAEQVPAWGPHADSWRARVAVARSAFAEMERQAREGVAAELANPDKSEAFADGGGVESDW